MLRLYLPSSLPLPPLFSVADKENAKHSAEGHVPVDCYYGWRGENYVFIAGTLDTMDDTFEKLQTIFREASTAKLARLDLGEVMNDTLPVSIIRWKLPEEALFLLSEPTRQGIIIFTHLINLATFLKSYSPSMYSLSLPISLRIYSLIVAATSRVIPRLLIPRSNFAQHIHQRCIWFSHSRPHLVHQVSSQGPLLDPRRRAQMTRALLSLQNHQQAIFLDWTLGFILGVALLLFRETIGQWIFNIAQHFYRSTLKVQIVWLMGYPAGLKLNGSLTRFLGQLHLWLLSLWGRLLPSVMWSPDDQLALPPNLTLPSVLVATLGTLSASMGCSLALAATSDILHLLLFPVAICSRIASRLYAWEVSVMLSLWRLFRGRRWNPLRERLDHAAYDLDQLLLGTVLFCTLLFLFPTVAVYHVLFAMIGIGADLLLLGINLLGLTIDQLPVYELCHKRDIVSALRCDINADDGAISLDYQHPETNQIIQPLLQSVGRYVGKHFSGRQLIQLVRGKV